MINFHLVIRRYTYSGVYYGLAKNAISETKRDRGIVTLEKMIPIGFWATLVFVCGLSVCLSVLCVNHKSIYLRNPLTYRLEILPSYCTQNNIMSLKYEGNRKTLRWFFRVFSIFHRKFLVTTLQIAKVVRSISFFVKKTSIRKRRSLLKLSRVGKFQVGFSRRFSEKHGSL